MNTITLMLLLITATLYSGERSPVPITARTVDSDTARFSVWQFKTFASKIKREIAEQEIIQSPKASTKKSPYHLAPMQHPINRRTL